MPSFLHTPDDTQQNVGDHDCTKLWPIQMECSRTQAGRAFKIGSGGSELVTHVVVGSRVPAPACCFTHSIVCASNITASGHARPRLCMSTLRQWATIPCTYPCMFHWHQGHACVFVCSWGSRTGTNGHTDTCTRTGMCTRHITVEIFEVGTACMHARDTNKLTRKNRILQVRGAALAMRAPTPLRQLRQRRSARRHQATQQPPRPSQNLLHHCVHHHHHDSSCLHHHHHRDSTRAASPFGCSQESVQRRARPIRLGPWSRQA
jgi:hypothetical protein